MLAYLFNKPVPKYAEVENLAEGVAQITNCTERVDVNTVNLDKKIALHIIN